MTERERTVIRLVGLVVHAVGLAWTVHALTGAPWPGLAAGLATFVVGGAWGWGMVVFAAREAADRERRREQERQYLARTGQGFTSSFDDEHEPAPIAPPPGATTAVPLKPWSP